MDNDSEIDIVKKYKKYPEFKKQMDQIQTFYNLNLNLALYQNLESIEKSKIFETIQTGVEDKIIIFFYGYRQIIENRDVDKIYRLYIRTYDQYFRNKLKKYSVVFFNSLCTSNDNFANFKCMYKTLPIMYYSKLDKIYVVHPSLSVKSLDWIVFGRFNKLFSKRLQFVNSLSDLNKYKLSPNISKIIPQQIINFNKSQFTKTPDIFPNDDSSFKRNQIKSMVFTKPKSPFDILIIPLQKYEMSVQGIPKLLKLLVSVFIYNPNLLQVQGIFRRCASIQEQQLLVTQLYSKNEKYLQSITDGIVISSVIKKIFINLTEPLFPYQIYEKIMKTTGIKPEQQVNFVKELIKSLPQLNSRVLIFFCNFIRQNVIAKQAITKMNCYNCSAIFSPCFFRPKTYQISDLICSGKTVKVLTIIFSKFQEIFGNTTSTLEFFRKSTEMKQKQQEKEKRSSTEKIKEYLREQTP